MRNRWYGYLAIAFLGLGLLAAPAVSRAEEITGDKTDLKIEQKSDQKIEENADWKKEVAPEPPKIEDQAAPKAAEKAVPIVEGKPVPKIEEKPALKNETVPKPKIEVKSNPIVEEKAAPKPEEKPAKKEGPFAFGKRWDTDTYAEIDVIFDHYWGSFVQVVKGQPIGARLRRGGDWKYVAFNFDIAGGYAGSLKSSTTTISKGNLGFGNINMRLNGVLPVLYGVMLQGGIMNESWIEYVDYKTPSQEDRTIYAMDGIGPDVVLSFSPIKYVSLNCEYSAVLKPIISYNSYVISPLNKDNNGPAANLLKDKYYDSTVNKTGYSTVEVGITARPLKYLSIGVAFGEKKASYQAAFKKISFVPNENAPEVKKTIEYKSLNDYIFVSLVFTY